MSTTEEFETKNQDFELYRLLDITSVLMGKVRQKELWKYGLTRSQAAVLECVHESGNNATPSRISHRMIREPQSVSGILNRMEREGFLTKTRDVHRKNMVRVGLTLKGEQAYNRAIKRKSARRIISLLSEDERHQLILCLKKLRDKSLRVLNRT